MYKRKSNQIFVGVCLAMLGLASGVFAVDFNDALAQSATTTQSLDATFNGKLSVGNLYNKNLRLVKQNESSSTQQALYAVLKYYTDQSCAVSSADVLYVLYSSDLSFKSFFDHTILTNISSKTFPSDDTIAASYNRFFTCAGIKNPSASDYSSLEYNISTLYYQSIQSSFFSATVAQDNYGEDLFRNGDADDSAFDLIIDINEVGKLFFSSFTTAPQTLFYKLPKAVAPLGSNTDSGGTGNSGGVVPSGGSGGSGLTQFQASAAMGKPSTASSFPGVYDVAPTSVISRDETPTVSKDSDVQQFVTTNNPTSVAQTSLSFVLGNQCVGTATPLTSLASKEEATITDEEYISDLVNFIDTANTNDIVHAVLASGFTADYQHFQKQNPATTVDSVANKYAELAFGDEAEAGTCQASCTGLPIDEQLTCQLNCTKSCMAQCDSLPTTDKVLCKVDCACFMIAGPNGDTWEKLKMTDLFNIKFCKVPVPTTSIPQTKSVYGLQSILQSLFDALQGLKSSGQTIKMKKTKEFLDLGIKLKLDELLDFKIAFAFKSLFPQKSDASKQREKVLANDKLTRVTVGNLPADADNYNKYIVVADYVKAKTDMENPPAGADQNVANAKTITAAQQETLSDPIAFQQKYKNAFLAENMITFLASNQQFWNQFTLVLNDMIDTARSLKSSIENSD